MFRLILNGRCNSRYNVVISRCTFVAEYLTGTGGHRTYLAKTKAYAPEPLLQMINGIIPHIEWA